MTFQEQIVEGIPSILPQPKVYEPHINHAPKRKEILSPAEKKLAIAVFPSDGNGFRATK